MRAFTVSSRLAEAHRKVSTAVRLSHRLRASDTALQTSSKASWQVVDRAGRVSRLRLKISLASPVCQATCPVKRLPA